MVTLMLFSMLGQTPSWKEIDELVNQQKVEAAAHATEQRLVAAKKGSDDAELAKALISLTQQRIALGGAETAVKQLKGENWPKALVPRTAVELFYVATLSNYLESYGYEIRKREKIDTKGAVDLKAWTAEDIRGEISRTYLAVWQRREALGTQPLGVLEGYLTPNNYPKGVRDTLRDGLTYLWVRDLAQSSWWTPEHSNSIYRLDLVSLIAGVPAKSASLNLADASVHPLERIGAILDDVEAWHRKANRPEAALNARLERLSVLRASFTDKAEKALIHAELETKIAASLQLPFSSFARATQAEWYRDDDEFVKGRDVAATGAQAFPTSIGGQRCAHLRAAFDAPEYTLQAMRVDGPGKRSVEIHAKNLRRLFLRAYRVDAQTLVSGKRKGSVSLNQDEVWALMRNGQPEAAWTVDLPATPDLKSHRTVVTPPLKALGLYAIVASVNDAFLDKSNLITCAMFFSSRLVLSVRQSPPDNAVEVVVRDGEAGSPLAGVKVELWSMRWDSPSQQVEAQVSAADGAVRFKGKLGTDRQYFLVARQGGDVVIDEGGLYFWNGAPSETNAALIYTDRTIYRPTQKVLWKVVAWRGQTESGALRNQPGTKLTVRLLDPNWQEVAKANVTTNNFASAAGEFVVPTGRLLGQWRLEVKKGDDSLGQSMVRVEEYKRPTFETTWKEGGPPARLNSPVTVTGEARFYFGLPVTSGAVKWKVERVPVYPWYWHWWHPTESRAHVVAAGQARLKDDGTFPITFTPLADPKLAKDVSYRYSISADVTDEGGETRQASKTIRVGNAAVEASFDIETGFFREDQPVVVNIRRTDLNGSARAGKGSWRIVALKQPQAAVLPADEPPVRGPLAAPKGLVTPGDEVRSRINPAYDVSAVLRSWADGPEKAKGELTHGADGLATVQLPSLPAGAWRVLYETKDEFGATWSMSKEVLVTGERNFPVMLPGLLEAERDSVEVGGTARLLIGSAFSGQRVLYEVYRSNQLIERRWFTAGSDKSIITRPVTAEDRGGFSVMVSVVRDWQVMQFQKSIFVPWDNKTLSLEFSTFRDTLKPGAKETFRITVKGQGKTLEAGAAEVLAYMYDQSLDLFGPHGPPSIPGLYPNRSSVTPARLSLGPANTFSLSRNLWFQLPSFPAVRDDALTYLDRWGIGGMGGRGGRFKGEGIETAMMDGERSPPASPGRAMMAKVALTEKPMVKGEAVTMFGGDLAVDKGQGDGPPVALRSNFSETAFFAPQLLTDGKGVASIEFKVPDSVTAWNVWAHALTRDLRGGSTKQVSRSVKDLMVRPYLPRFLRESDQATINVVVNNASKGDLSGQLSLDIIDSETQKSVAAEFGHKPGSLPFTVKAGQGTTLTFPVVAPKRVGQVEFKVVATSGDTSDGELRALPLLPSRMRLAQSRFVTLKDKDSRTMKFDDLANTSDTTRINEQLVVTVDAQLFYSVLSALPYLVRYPYECSEQTLNRFLSTGIVNSVFRDNPAIADMGKKLAKRSTQYETFDALDPNRKMTLEESPWLLESQGKQGPEKDELISMLDPKVVDAEQNSALTRLRKIQTPQGGFPWFPGGPPSSYMTTYLLYGFSKALEFKVEVPKEMATSAWTFVAEDYRSTVKKCMSENSCWQYVTFLNYVASAFPDDSWLGGALSAPDRQEMLSFSFKHWKEHSPYLKGMLALTLKRSKRDGDAKLVFDSVMDSAKSTQDDGTFWQPEDRAWLWYNDTIESHAFALRVLNELSPKDSRRAGLVQWLLLNKKLNHWKSTKATAEVLYSMVKYLQSENQLGKKEESHIEVGTRKATFTFLPDEYTGKKNQLVIPGDQLDPKTQSTVTVSKSTPGFQFASATWHFSTDQLPAEAKGDLFHVERTYFKRVRQGTQTTLQPLRNGASFVVGDELEVQLSIRARQAAEYVHLRDPRAAGFEPENATSKYQWDLGVVRYEEFRDSGTNFFFEALPAGEYTMKYRVRAATGGTFRVGPATLQSMYAPEFTAYSAGQTLTIAPSAK